MTQGETGRIGVSIDIKPHAYDPARNPELFRGVLGRRFIAFVIDVVIIMLPVAFAAVCIFFLGLVTFLLGWALFWLLYPAAIVWALVYCGATLGGTGLGHDRDADHGARDAHLLRRAVLFRIGYLTFETKEKIGLLLPFCYPFGLGRPQYRPSLPPPRSPNWPGNCPEIADFPCVKPAANHCRG